MTYIGYLTLDGVELVNAERAETYVRKNLPGFPLRSFVGSDVVRQVIGDPVYESPAVDDAPWVDHNDPATYGFYGAIPLSIEGMDQSTREAEVIESILTGGSVGAIRRATKPVRVTVMLVGRDEASVDAGRIWLDHALDPSSCSTHGGTCGAADLFYYRARPEFDPFAVNRSLPVMDTSEFVSVTSATSPVSARLPLDNGPARAQWTATVIDGTVVVFGAIAEDSSEVVRESPPIMLQRTNLYPNPSWTANANGARRGRFPLNGPLGPAEHILTGGTDGGAYVRARGVEVPEVSFNYAPNPSAEYDMLDAGWSTNSPAGIERVPFPAPQTPGAYAAQAVRTAVGPGQLWIDITSLGPDEPVNGSVTFWLVDPGPASLSEPSTGRVTVYDPAGAVVSTGQFNIPTTYTRQSIQTKIGAGYRVRVETDSTLQGSGLRLDGVIFSATTFAPTYYDGDSAPTSTRVSAWTGEPGRSVSRLITGLADEATIFLDLPTLPPEATTLSLSLKSLGPADFRIVTYDTDTDVIVSTTTVKVGSTWSRASVPVRANRSTGVYVTTRGPSNVVEIDDVLLERGDQVRPFFRVSDQVVDGYRSEWLAGVDQSASRLIWASDLVTDRDVSDWRPFFRVVSGRADTLTLTTEQFAGNSIDDCVEPFERTMRHVTCIEGPSPVRSLALSLGAAKIYDFTLVAGKPYEFSTPRNVIDTNLLDEVTYEQGADDCPPPAVSIIQDPNAPVLPSPPRPPAVPSQYLEDPPTLWTRHFMSIPAEEVSEWVSVVPTVKITTKGDAERNLRFRFHPNPFEYPLLPAQESRVNLAISPHASATLHHWGSVGPTTSNLSYGLHGPEGKTPFARSVAKAVTPQAGFGLRYGGTGNMLVTPGSIYSASMDVGVVFDMKKRKPKVVSSRAVRLEMHFINSAGATIAAAYGPYKTVTVNRVERLTATNVNAPAGSVRAVLIVRAQTDAQIGDGVMGTEVMFEQSSTIKPFFSGDSVSGEGGVAYGWVGGQNRSPSTATYSPIDTCNWCAEFIVAYMPAHSELIMDGQVQSATIAVNGAEPVTANHLLFGTGGVPVTWPELECGQTYFLTIDTAGDSDADVSIDLSRRE